MTDALIPNDVVTGAWADVSVPDIVLNGLKINRAPANGVPLAGHITDGNISRSIDQASTVSLTIHDPQRQLLKSGLLAQKSTMHIDQYMFSLAAVDTSGDELTLTFEDQAVNLLRQHAVPRKSNRKKVTRAQFAKLLCDEVPKLSFFCPELNIKEPIAGVKQTASQKKKDANKEYGFPGKIPSNLTIKNTKVTKEQLKNIDLVLQQGVAMGADPFVLITSIGVMIDENSCNNIDGGDRDSIGLFQQRASWGTHAQRIDPTQSAKLFFERAIPEYNAHKADKNTLHRGYNYPTFTMGLLGDIIQVPQNLAGGMNPYERYMGEAKLIYANWSGADATVAGGTVVKKAYEFERGGPGRKGENSWACLQRLAQEVNWLCFVIGYTVYFISQTTLYTSRAIATIDRNTDGVHEIDFSYDLGKPVSEARLTVSAAKWQIDPGAVIKVENSGPCDGKWLIQNISRSLFDNTATVTLVKPTAQLPEPAPQTASASAGKNKLVTAGALSGDEVVSIALGLVSPPPSYKMGANHPGLTLDQVLSGKFETVPFDCSSFVRWAWMEGGHVDICPGGGNTDAIVAFAKTKSKIWRQGTIAPPGGWLAGDVIFPHSSHVVLCGGDGKTVEAEGRLYGIVRRPIDQVFPGGTAYFWFRPLPDGG